MLSGSSNLSLTYWDVGLFRSYGLGLDLRLRLLSAVAE